MTNGTSGILREIRVKGQKLQTATSFIRMQAFKMRCYQSLLNFHVKTMSPRRMFAERSKQLFRIYDKLLISVKNWKLRWFGHVSRSLA